MKGWVYVISNIALPDLVKVGYTMKDPEQRAKELKNTGSPHPYLVDYEALTEDPREVEQEAHELLSSKHEGKEWFKCSSEEAITAIKEAGDSQIINEIYKRADREKAEALILAETIERQLATCRKKFKKELEESKRATDEAFSNEKSKVMERSKPDLRGRPFYEKPFWHWNFPWHTAPCPSDWLDTMNDVLYGFVFFGMACFACLFLPIAFLLLLAGVPWFDTSSSEVYEAVFSVTLVCGYALLILHALYFVWRGPREGELRIALDRIAPELARIENEREEALRSIEKTCFLALCKRSIKVQCNHCGNQIEFHPFKEGLHQIPENILASPGIEFCSFKEGFQPSYWHSPRSPGKVFYPFNEGIHQRAARWHCPQCEKVFFREKVESSN
jgi:hypothetical protein